MDPQLIMMLGQMLMQPGQDKQKQKQSMLQNLMGQQPGTGLQLQNDFTSGLQQPGQIGRIMH